MKNHKTISEVIRELEHVKERYGDLPFYDFDRVKIHLGLSKEKLTKDVVTILDFSGNYMHIPDEK